MQAQTLGRQRDIALAGQQGLLDMLPFELLERRCAGREVDAGVDLALAEGSDDFIGASGLGQIVHGAELDGLHGGRDAREAGQDRDARGGIEPEQRPDQFETRVVIQPQISHHVVGRIVLGDG